MATLLASTFNSKEQYIYEKGDLCWIVRSFQISFNLNYFCFIYHGGSEVGSMCGLSGLYMIHRCMYGCVNGYCIRSSGGKREMAIWNSLSVRFIWFNNFIANVQ